MMITLRVNHLTAGDQILIGEQWMLVEHINSHHDQLSGVTWQVRAAGREHCFYDGDTLPTRPFADLGQGSDS